MVCGSIVEQKGILQLKESPMPPRHQKMNGDYCATVETRSFYLHRLPPRYPSVSKPVFSSLAAGRNFSPTLCIAFACACILSSAVLAEQNGAYANSSNTYKIDGTDNVKPCSNCVKFDLKTMAENHLEDLKSHLLKVLGFTHGVPNVTNLASKIPPVDLLSKVPVEMLEFHKSSSHIRHEYSHGSHGSFYMQNDEAQYDDSDALKTHTVVAQAKEGEYGT